MSPASPGTGRVWIELSVARAGLSQRIGEAIFSADRVARPKPAPDVYLLAAQESGVAPEKAKRPPGRSRRDTSGTTR